GPRHRLPCRSARDPFGRPRCPRRRGPAAGLWRGDRGSRPLLLLVPGDAEWPVPDDRDRIRGDCGRYPRAPRRLTPHDPVWRAPVARTRPDTYIRRNPAKGPADVLLLPEDEDGIRG